ncbi:MAG: FG-GAP repeat domain-containing protein, partial [Planctomycetota bacterium]
MIVAVVAVVSWPARSAVDQAMAETAKDPMPYMGAAGRSCTHPLFATAPYAAGDQPIRVAVGDLDGVNGPDLAVANRYSDAVSVLLNQGDGTLAAPVTYAAGDGPFSVAVGDLDGVNGPDITVANHDSDDVSVLLNQG